MLTNNFKGGMRCWLSDTSVTCYSVNGNSTYWNYDSSLALHICLDFLDDAKCAVLNDNSGGGVWFGRGDTPATVDDKTLVDPITTGLSFSGSYRYATYDAETNVVTNYASYLIRNTSAADITIKEMGWFYNGANTNSKYNIMLDRTVLDEPITIPPQECSSITYKISFNLSFEA